MNLYWWSSVVFTYFIHMTNTLSSVIFKFSVGRVASFLQLEAFLFFFFLEEIEAFLLFKVSN